MNETELDKYLYAKSMLLVDFKKYWLRGHDKSPNMFPLTMPDGMWDDEVEFFADNHDQIESEVRP